MASPQLTRESEHLRARDRVRDAGPELLGACKQWLEAIGPDKPFRDDQFAYEQAILTRMGAAVAKAEGREP